MTQDTPGFRLSKKGARGGTMASPASETEGSVG